MGASQSELEAWEDEGPPVTRERVARLVAAKEGVPVEEVDLGELEESAGKENGEGFASDLVKVKFEATVSGTRKDYQWVVKSTPRQRKRGAESRKAKIDEREVFVYSTLVPELRGLLEERGEGLRMPQFCPTVAALWDDTDKILVLENMRNLGFEDAREKKAGLDRQHIDLVLDWLARFHASSLCLLQEDEKQGKEGDRWRMVKENFWNTPNFEERVEEMSAMAKPWEKSLVEVIDEAYPGKDYSKKWGDFIERVGDVMVATHEAYNKDFRVKTFIHGDPWFNNMFFKYSADGSVEDLLMFDLQMINYTSPAMDLAYFLFASTTKAERADITSILSHYHTTLMDNIAAMGGSLEYSLEELAQDYKVAKINGLLFAMKGLPTVLIDKEKLPDMEEVITKMNEDMMTDDPERKKELAAEMGKEIFDQFVGLFKDSPVAVLRVKEALDEMIEENML